MPLADLPTELLQLIYCFLEQPSSLRACNLVCRKMHYASQNAQVYRALFCKLFDDSFARKSREIPYEVELRARWQLLLTPMRITAGNLCVLEKILLEADSFDLENIGKNLTHLGSTEIWQHLPLDCDKSLDVNQSFEKVKFLTLISCMMPSWRERVASHSTSSSSISLEVLFAHEDLFFSKVIRSDLDSSRSAIICTIPPPDFAGDRSISTPDWLIFMAIARFIVTVTNKHSRLRVLEEDFPSPLAILHTDKSNDTTLRKYSWIGIYVYIDFDSFQWLVNEYNHAPDRFPDFDPYYHSDGTQTCNFELHKDGTVTGDGRGAWSRSNGGYFTLSGVWTMIAGCPPGFKRIAFVKKYEHEDMNFRTRWLYDGLLVPGRNGGIFIGRWKDGTEQFPGEVAVTGPFIFVDSATDLEA